MDTSEANPVGLPATPCESERIAKAVKDGAVRCKAKSKRTGLRCGAAAVIGMEVCYHHGGATPRGVASPHFKGKGYDLDLGLEKGEAHRRVTRDEAALLNLSGEVGLLVIRLKELLKREITGERGTVWDDLQGLVIDAQAEGLTALPIASIAPLVDAGKGNDALWREVGDWIQGMGKIVSIEGRRKADMGEIATKEDMRALVVTWLNLFKDAVATHVLDPQQQQAALQHVSRELVRMNNRQKPALQAESEEP